MKANDEKKMQTTCKSSEKPNEIALFHENKFDERIIHKFTVRMARERERVNYKRESLQLNIERRSQNYSLTYNYTSKQLN